MSKARPAGCTIQVEPELDWLDLSIARHKRHLLNRAEMRLETHVNVVGFRRNVAVGDCDEEVAAQARLCRILAQHAARRRPLAEASRFAGVKPRQLLASRKTAMKSSKPLPGRRTKNRRPL